MKSPINRLLTEYLPTLRQFAISKTKSEQDADDLLQDTAVRMIRSQDKISELPYADQQRICYTTLKNLFIDLTRDMKRRRVHDTVSLSHNSFETEGYGKRDPYVDPEVESKLELKSLMKGLEKINHNHKNALMLFVNGYSCKAIARFYKVQLNTGLGYIRYGRIAARKISEGLKTPKPEMYVEWN
jgi:RNA polymerase sigma factor (sigma-70 family)